MIDITKLTHAHIGRRVIDLDMDIGEIYGFNEDEIEVVYSGGRSYLFDPADLKFYDFPGGLTIGDIGSRWIHRGGNEFVFNGGEFASDGKEVLIFSKNDTKYQCSEDVFKEIFTRMQEPKEKEEYTLCINRKVSKKQYEAINKILQDENNAQ